MNKNFVQYIYKTWVKHEISVIVMATWMIENKPKILNFVRFMQNLGILFWCRRYNIQRYRPETEEILPLEVEPSLLVQMLD